MARLASRRAVGILSSGCSELAVVRPDARLYLGADQHARHAGASARSASRLAVARAYRRSWPPSGFSRKHMSTIRRSCCCGRSGCCRPGRWPARRLSWKWPARRNGTGFSAANGLPRQLVLSRLAADSSAVVRRSQSAGQGKDLHLADVAILAITGTGTGSDSSIAWRRSTARRSLTGVGSFHWDRRSR